MAENLSYGLILGSVQTPVDNCVDEQKCQPDDAGCSGYGGYYQWNELMRYGFSIDSKGICPPEWHVPSKAEWQVMLNELGTWVVPPDGVAGSSLRDTSFTVGFNALPAGIFYHDNRWSFNTGNLTGTMFWTSTPDGAGRAVSRGVNSLVPSISLYSGSRENAYPVRCVKD
jgi:uncharacterized protein (TIGR02145 family)